MSSTDRNLPEDAAEGKLPVTSRADQTRNRRLVKKEPLDAERLSPEQRLLLLDTWRRSGLPARDFAALVGVSRHTLYSWKKKFDAEGPAGLVDKPRGGPTGSRLPELTRRAILMLKEANPTWGCQRISGSGVLISILLRGPACLPVPGPWQVLAPVGATEDSPAVHCWVSAPSRTKSRRDV